MFMRRQAISGIILAILALVLFAFQPKTGLADLPQPHEDYTKTSPDNSHVLVMFVTPKAPYDYFDTKIDQSLRDKYKVSGLYKNDGSTDPLWTLGFWDYEDYLFLSSDGKHLVHLTIGLSNDSHETLDNDALYFYENGSVMRRYEFADLIKDPANLPKPQYNGPWSYSWLRSYHFDDSKNWFDLTTKFGEEYRFDVTTGKIVHDVLLFTYLSQIPWPIFVLIGLLLISITGFIIDYRKGKLG